MVSGKKGNATIKCLAMLLAGTACFLSGPSNLSAAQWNIGVSGGDNGINSFQLSVGEYYHVPKQEVVVVHERGIPEEELPVVFFIAERAHVSPDRIVKLRKKGMSWMDITLHFGLKPDIYYVPVRNAHPCGNAYGYYGNHGRGDWKNMHFGDRDIVNQVNLRFISEHRGYSPEKIMSGRSDGKSFTRIHKEASQGKQVRPTIKNHPDKTGSDFGKQVNGHSSPRQNVDNVDHGRSKGIPHNQH